MLHWIAQYLTEKTNEKEQTDPLAAADCKEEDDREEGRRVGGSKVLLLR